jgi:DNA-binding transcriptional LysR family regulator
MLTPHAKQSPRLDLNLLVVLDTILQEGNITRAAGRLNLTQPAISHALARLRVLFGDELFVRKGRSMVPTPLCRSLAEPTRRSLRVLEATLQNATHFDPHTIARQFTLGIRDVMEANIVAPLMRGIGNDAPLIDITCTHVDRSSLEDALASGAVDVAVDIFLLLPDTIERRCLDTAELCVVAARDHPAIQGELTLDTYLKSRHILVSRRRQGGGFEDFELSQLGLQREIKLRCQQYFTACRVASQTELITTIPTRIATVINGAFGNQILKLPFDSRRMELYLYWHRNSQDNTANRWLRERILETWSHMADGQDGFAPAAKSDSPI